MGGIIGSVQSFQSVFIQSIMISYLLGQRQLAKPIEGCPENDATEVHGQTQSSVGERVLGIEVGLDNSERLPTVVVKKC